MKQLKHAGYKRGCRVKIREGWRGGMHRCALVWPLAAALALLGTADALARHKHRSPHHKKPVEVEHHKHVEKAVVAEPLPPNLSAAKQAIELVRRRKAKDATALAASSDDPAVAKLVQWALLRHSDSETGVNC
jgi:hypothetical protein